MMGHDDMGRRGAYVVGVVLVVLGLAFLAARQLDLDLGRVSWPIWVIAPGVLIFALGLAAGEPAGSGFAILGSMIAATGLLLGWQDATGAWASWAYAWALIAPGSVGAGMVLYGLLAGRTEMAASGLRVAAIGFAMFLVGAFFFEGILGISGGRIGFLGDVVGPAALVALGALIVISAVAGGRRRPDWPQHGPG
jgi:hypothetical protein